MKINLRFVEKMYSFPDNLRNPSCDKNILKSEKQYTSKVWQNVLSTALLGWFLKSIIIDEYIYEHS